MLLHSLNWESNGRLVDGILNYWLNCSPLFRSSTFHYDLICWMFCIWFSSKIRKITPLQESNLSLKIQFPSALKLSNFVMWAVQIQGVHTMTTIQYWHVTNILIWGATNCKPGHRSWLLSWKIRRRPIKMITHFGNCLLQSTSTFCHHTLYEYLYFSRDDAIRFVRKRVKGLKKK